MPAGASDLPGLFFLPPSQTALCTTTTQHTVHVRGPDLLALLRKQRDNHPMRYEDARTLCVNS